MPLIEIINITLLAFSVGLLALMGISYLIYRYRDINYKSNDNSKQVPIKILTKEISAATNTSAPLVNKNIKNVSRYQIVKTYSQSKVFESKTQTAEKFVIVNKTAPALRKTHSPKFIYLVTSPANK